MAGFADELRSGIDRAARKMAEAQLAGDDYGAAAWHERLSYLRSVARRHGVEFPLVPGPAGGQARGRTAVTSPADGGAQAGRPAASTRKEAE
jgi:hypothetical protein